tara:strand:+ start:231 stop:395 length:165 start_codon:yes stop_codon:yes gene_type:complete
MAEFDFRIEGSMADVVIRIDGSILAEGMDICAEATPARRATAAVLLNSIFVLTK